MAALLELGHAPGDLPQQAARERVRDSKRTEHFFLSGGAVSDRGRLLERAFVRCWAGGFEKLSSFGSFSGKPARGPSPPGAGAEHSETRDITCGGGCAPSGRASTTTPAENEALRRRFPSSIAAASTTIKSLPPPPWNGEIGRQQWSPMPSATPP